MLNVEVTRGTMSAQCRLMINIYLNLAQCRLIINIYLKLPQCRLKQSLMIQVWLISFPKGSLAIQVRLISFPKDSLADLENNCVKGTQLHLPRKKIMVRDVCDQIKNKIIPCMNNSQFVKRYINHNSNSPT